jgi:hypothetical protein
MIFLLTFSDIYSSLECQKTFRRAGIKCSIDNAPANLGLSCGYAVSCEASDITAVNKILQENNIAYSKIISVEE